MTQPNTSKIDEALNSIKVVTINQGTGIDGGSVYNAKQEILKHFKALIEESKPPTMTKDGVAFREGWNDDESLAYDAASNLFEQNLLKRVEEM